MRVSMSMVFVVYVCWGTGVGVMWSGYMCVVCVS